MAYNPTPFAKPGKGFICDLLGERRSIGQHNLDSIWEFLQQIHLYQYPSIGEPGHSCCGNVTVDWLSNHAAKFERHKGVQHLKGKLGSFTQVGSFVMSLAWKSKNSSMIFKISGQPKTK